MGPLPVYRAHMYSIWRSNTAKVTLFSSLIIPLVIDAALPGATAVTVLAFVVGAGGAIIATNAYSYDHTGTLWLLAFRGGGGSCSQPRRWRSSAGS